MECSDNVIVQPYNFQMSLSWMWCHQKGKNRTGIESSKKGLAEIKLFPVTLAFTCGHHKN